MKVGEIWIEKETEDPDNPEAIKIIGYFKADLWAVITGEMDNDIFVADDGFTMVTCSSIEFDDDDLDDDEFLGLESSEVIMSGEEIFENYYKMAG